MTQLINDLDLLRIGKIKNLNVNGHIINHARDNRFYMVKNKSRKIINEWDLILKLS